MKKTYDIKKTFKALKVVLNKPVKNEKSEINESLTIITVDTEKSVLVSSNLKQLVKASFPKNFSYSGDMRFFPISYNMVQTILKEKVINSVHFEVEEIETKETETYRKSAVVTMILNDKIEIKESFVNWRVIPYEGIESDVPANTIFSLNNELKELVKDKNSFFYADSDFKTISEEELNALREQDNNKGVYLKGEDLKKLFSIDSDFMPFTNEFNKNLTFKSVHFPVAFTTVQRRLG